MYSDEVFLDIREFLKMEQAERDRYLTEFARGWGKTGNSREGVNDGPPPQWWVDEYFKRQAHKETSYINVPGTSTYVGRDENGNVIIRATTGFIQINADNWAAFLRVALSLPMGAEMPGTTSYGGVSHQTGDASQKAMLPEHKHNLEENERRLNFAMEHGNPYPPTR